MIFEAIAAIKIANEAIGAIKEFAGHVQSVGEMGPQLTKLADAKEVENGRFDVTKFKPLTRLGYRDYAIIEKTFELARPDEGKNPNIKPRT